MYEFNGFGDWIPIFRGGRQVDSRGREHDGGALIERAVASFDAARHEPPVVIGHPVENGPAFGWVSALKREGDLLLARFRQVQPEFEEMVRRGLFKKRSASFYKDGSLRHVGFLGAAPPAVKGLPDLAFSDAADATFEFAEEWKWAEAAGLFRRLREWLIEKFGQDTADRIVPDWTIEGIRAAPGEDAATTASAYREKEEEMNFREFVQKLKELVAGIEPEAQADSPAGKSFSEAELAEAIRKAADEAARAERQKVAAEFTEQARKTRQDDRRREIASWCDSMVAQGRLTPAMVKFGVPEFLAAFAEREEVVEFADGEVRATLYDRFRAFVETELPKVVEFREVATREKDVTGGSGAGERLSALVRQRMDGDRSLSYGAAFAEVQRENPDLAREYHQEIGG